MRDYLSVGLRMENMPLFLQISPQLLIILNDAVMSYKYLFFAAKVRMSIVFCYAAMGSLSTMPNAYYSFDRSSCNLFLKRGGLAMVAIKARSVDVAEKPVKIFADAKRQLEEAFRVVDYRNLEPFQKDHAFFVCVKR